MSTKPTFFHCIHSSHPNPLNAAHFFLFFPPSVPFPCLLIAPPVSLPSNSLPFMLSISYRSDWIFICTVLTPWSPVPLCLLPAVFVHCSLWTEMRWLEQLRHNHQSIYKSIMPSPAGTSARPCVSVCVHFYIHWHAFNLPPFSWISALTLILRSISVQFCGLVCHRCIPSTCCCVVIGSSAGHTCLNICLSCVQLHLPAWVLLPSAWLVYPSS